MLFLSWVLSVSAAWAVDPQAIVRKSVERDQANWERARDYVYVTRSVIRERDSDGKITKTEQEGREYLMLYGEPYRRVIEKDGRPLAAAEAAKEQAKLDKVAEKRRKETPEERARRIENWRKDRLKEREIALEIPAAYHFTLLREETVNGRPAWVLDATPRPDYKPKNWRAGMLKKFKGRMWIDQQDYQWVRMEGEVIDTVSFGLFLARLAKGSTIFFEQARVNDEVWAPKLIRFSIDARLALLKRILGDQEITFSDFRKFQAESRIVAASELKK
jgi:hypothetical protein